ncbi:MAG: hypothetical protein AAB262_09895 [Elusimicrobiota bacterium]
MVEMGGQGEGGAFARAAIGNDEAAADLADGDAPAEVLGDPGEGLALDGLLSEGGGGHGGEEAQEGEGSWFHPGIIGFKTRAGVVEYAEFAFRGSGGAFV